MNKNESIRKITIDLLNRRFLVADIKKHLLSLNYKEDEVENVVEQVLDERESTLSVSSKMGYQGFIWMLVGILFLFGFWTSGSRSGNNFIRFGKLIVGIMLLGMGIFVITRPLKDE